MFSMHISIFLYYKYQFSLEVSNGKKTVCDNGLHPLGGVLTLLLNVRKIFIFSHLKKMSTENERL